MPPVPTLNARTSARRDDPASAPSRPSDEAAGPDPGVRAVGMLFLLSASFLGGAALTLLVT